MLLFASLFFLFSHGCSSSEPELLKPEPRIVGGTDANIKQCPYLAQFGLNGYMVCGASIISPFYAVSAAHCTINNGAYTLRAGTSLLDEGGIVVKVRLIFIHPGYDQRTSRNDITVLYLAAPLPFGETIQPVKLPNDNRFLRPGRLGTVTGWGTINSNSDIMSKVLQQVQLPVTDPTSCMNAYFGSLDLRTTFCAGYMRGERDACRGDSGGPFVIEGVLVGIVSWGIGCAEPGYPGVYTNVASFRTYIKEKTGV